MIDGAGKEAPDRKEENQKIAPLGTMLAANNIISWKSPISNGDSADKSGGGTFLFIRDFDADEKLGALRVL